jgi:predicted AlkP superfamily phosphohydrolase/phosphomutase
MFWYEFNRFDSGIYAFGFDAGDRLQHLFWTQKVLTASNNTLPKEIEDYYTEKDAFLGQVLDKMDGDTKLIIFSDHGFDSFERAVTINRWLVDNGYMALTQEPAGREEGGLFKYVDWSRTRAYSLGFASVYINVKGREGQGIVDESEKDKLVDEIASKLSNLTDTNGKSVIKNVYKGREIYSGPYAEDGPDMIVGFQEGYRMSWQNAVGGLTAETINDNTLAWTGDHLIDRSFVPAVLFTNFKIKKAAPQITDIAPTILKLEQLQVPNDMDGEALV